MEYESEIKRLEEFVERLLEGYTGLQTEIKQLKRAVESQKDENDKLMKQIAGMESERGDLGSRVGSLIERIEAWESELETSGFADSPPEDPAEEDTPRSKRSDKQAEEQQNSDSGGGVQGSLFTANSTMR